jgi:hypothetical protein
MPPRALGAVLLIGAVSILSLGRLFVQISDFYPTAKSPDGVTEFESRFAGLRAILPAKGIIGYITDEGVDPASADAQAELRLTQYAVAPVLVVNSPAHRFVIGNFHREVTTGALRDRGFIVVQAFGNGIVLLQKEEAK